MNLLEGLGQKGLSIRWCKENKMAYDDKRRVLSVGGALVLAGCVGVAPEPTAEGKELYDRVTKGYVVSPENVIRIIGCTERLVNQIHFDDTRKGETTWSRCPTAFRIQMIQERLADADERDGVLDGVITDEGVDILEMLVDYSEQNGRKE